MKISERKAGILLSYLSQAILIISNLVYTPIMLRILGQSEYGLYQLVYSVISYLGLLSFGFTMSYIRFYSIYKAKNDEEEIARLNGMFFTIFCVMGTVCFICGMIMMLNINFIFKDGLTDLEYKKAKILMFIMVINLSVTFPDCIFTCNTSAHEKFIFEKILSVLYSILNPFITLPVLLLGFGSVGMIVVSTILVFIKIFVNIFFNIKKLHMRFIFRGFRLGLLKEMWVFTFFIFLNQIIDQINWSVDKFLLGRLKGTETVAIYGVASHINQMCINFSVAVSNVFAPQINSIVASDNDNKKLTSIFVKVGRIQFILLSLIVTGFIFFGKPFINMWAGYEYRESYSVALILVIPAMIELCQNIGIEIQRAKNKHKVRSVVYFFIAVGNILISIPLIKLFGARGAALGTCISLIAGTLIFMNIYYQMRIGLNVVFYWKEIISIFISLIPAFIAGEIIRNVFTIDTWIKLFACAFLYSIFYIFFVWRYGMNENEKKIIKHIIAPRVKTVKD